MAKHKWIKAATKNKGALHRHLDVPEGEKIPEDKLQGALHSASAKVRKEARLAMTLKGMHHTHKGKSKRAKMNTMYGKK